VGVFSGLEGSLEKYIEGFFKDKFKSRVQPAVIAKKLAREMRDRRRVGINRIYVPNSFTVYLNPEDYDSISSLALSLSKELQEYVSQKAKEKQYSLAGAPVVEFVMEENEETGFMHIVSAFSEDMPEQSPSVQEEKAMEQTQTFSLTSEMMAFKQRKRFNPWLEVAVGPERGRIIQVSKSYYLMGRHSGCDILLRDSTISRQQARLERDGESVTIEDLGSANGTWVNGVRIGRKTLRPGDEIALGTTVCIFKVD